MKDEKYFLVKSRAVPDVLMKVVEAKRLLESGKYATVQEAAETVGISRSSFYKYKDDIFPFHENSRGKTFTFLLRMEDRPGLLSQVLKQVAGSGVNILTIHQSIPVNGVALLTLSVEVLPESEELMGMIDKIEALEGVQSLKILARE